MDDLPVVTHHLLLPKQYPSIINNKTNVSNFFGWLYKSCFGIFFFSRGKGKGGKKNEEEEKVYKWLYALAKSERDIVFEYVQGTERGLSFREAERRRKENGPNVLLTSKIPSWWQFLWSAFFHPFNLILVFLASCSYISRDYPNGSIMIAWVLISVALRFSQEYSSSKAAMKLSELLKCPVRVQRCAGRVVQTELIVQIDQKDIVPGDIIIFGPGDLFPADVRLLDSKDLIVSQSSLTGESGTMEKLADIREDQATPLIELMNICFMGTSVISGSGTGLVVSTGSKTYMSTIFSALGNQKPVDVFQKGVQHVSYSLICVLVVIVPIIILAYNYSSMDTSGAILFGISVAVALTPQMLPLIVNTNLAIGALAMARDKCIVKSLASIQNMGAMDILCIDKTGTLTMDLAFVVHHLDSWGVQKEQVLRFAFLNSYFKTELKNPVDDAILVYVYTNGYRFEPSKWLKIHEIPFNFTRRIVSIIIRSHAASSDRLIVTKGALEEVIKVSSSFEHADSGITLPFSIEDRQRVLLMGEKLNNDGLRVIGIATRRIKMEDSIDARADDSIIESDLVFLGIITFFDPPKDSAKQALCRLAERGVKAKVLTGDSLSLAIKVCKEVGMETTHVITGPELDLIDQDIFHETVKQATVLARLTPAQKLRVVQSLQTYENHVVGFLGDGINDALVLDAADVGISVDSGASVTKDLADIILLEKDLNVLVAGVERGRITYGNTMKYIKLSLITNTGTVISILIATLVLGFEPLTPRQLLTQNFIYNLSQIVIPWDNIDKEYVESPQTWIPEGLPLFMLWNGPVCSICDVSALLFIRFYYGSMSHLTDGFFRSAWFVEGLLMQTLTIHLIRTAKIPFFQEAASWPVICSTILISGIGIAFPFTPIGNVLGMVDLPLSYFAFLIILFVGYFVFGQVVKRVYILVYKRWL